MDFKNKGAQGGKLGTRKPQNPNMIYGIRAAIETIRSGQEIEKLFIQKGLKGELIKELFDEMRGHSIPLSKVPVEKLNRLTRKNHQGVVGFISPVRYHKLDHLITGVFEKGEEPFLIILDRVTDVRNFGAIARSAEGAGAHGIIIPLNNSAQINADAIKTSAGALTSLPVCRVEDLKEAVQFIKDSGCRVMAASEKGGKPVFTAKMSGPIAIVMGSEENGVSDELLEIADKLVKIPMQGNIQSLNVAAACSIVAFEVLRQRTAAN